MSAITRLVMQKFYRDAAGRPERLPWHQNAPPPLLAKAVAARSGRGRALDVGCGAGVFTVWMAEQGMDVTGIDMFPEAIAMAQRRANEHGVRPALLVTDLFTYAPERPFDLVFDSGCLHSLVGGNVGKYKRQLLQWLAPGGDYILGHWGKRHALDWRPVGPRRRSIPAVERIFAPELELRETDVTDFSAAFPFGPVVRGVGYWFRS